MPFIPAVIEIDDSDGDRVDLPVNGVQQPIVIKLDNTLTFSSRDKGNGQTEVTIGSKLATPWNVDGTPVRPTVINPGAGEKFTLGGDGSLSINPGVASVKAVALSNVVLAGPDWSTALWDGATVNAGESVLLNQQTISSENGIYLKPSSGAMTRSSVVLTCGTRVYVEQGEIYQGKTWVLETINPITIGSTALSWNCTDGPRTAAPLTTLTASGAGVWVTLLTIPGPSTNDYDLEIVVDNVSTKSDGSVVARSRGPTTYRRHAGTLTLADDSRYLLSPTYLRQTIDSGNVLLQAFQQASGGGNYGVRTRAWYEYIRAL